MERHNQMLSDVFGIRTVAELWSIKHFAVAGALLALGNKMLVRLIFLNPLPTWVFKATMISQHDPMSSNGKVSAGALHLTPCMLPNNDQSGLALRLIDAKRS
jgi:hypothetical protein